MSKNLISAVLGMGILALTASGQQTTQPAQQGQPSPGLPGSNPQPGLPTKLPVITHDAKLQSSDPTDAQVQAALVHDGDVRIAQAKMQLAEAELAKAKQAVMLRVMMLNATIREQSMKMNRLANELKRYETLFTQGTIDLKIVEETRQQQEMAKNVLAKTEMEMKLLTGSGPKMAAKVTSTLDRVILEDAVFALEFEVRREVKRQADLAFLAAKSPITDRIRAALDKPVKLAPKGTEVSFEKALEVFKKEAGLDVPVRISYKVHPLLSEGEELPVGAWFQLFADYDRQQKQPKETGPLYLVRDYGILVASKEAAPPDALTLAALWKQPLKKDDPKSKDANASW